MLFLQHLWELILFICILLGPLPLCVSLILNTDSEEDKSSFSHYLLVILTCWCLIEVSIGLSLGMIGKFTLSGVLICELIVLIVGIVIFLSINRYKLPFFVQNLLVFKQPLNHIEMLSIGAVSFVGVILLERLATRPNIDYDSLWYHLPTMARWYQEGSFIRLDEFSHSGDLAVDAVAYYPYNWEILCTFFVMPFREDFLVAFPNLIAWLVLGLAIYLISVRLGATRFHAIAGSSLVLTLPLLLPHVNTLHVDLPFAAFFMVGLYFAVLYNQTHSFLALALFIASLGMLFGLKTSAIGYGFLLVALLILMEAKTLFFKKKSIAPVITKPKVSIYLGLAGIFCFFFVGGFWYFKNLVDVGNPLGNIKVQIAGITVFPGTIDMALLSKTSLANLFDLTNLSHLKLLGLQSLVRLQLPFLAMVLQVLLLPYALLTRQKRIRKEYLLGIVLLLIATGLLYWKTPFSGTFQLLPLGSINPYIGQQARFAFPFMSLLGVTAAVVATATRSRDKGIAVIVLISCFLSIVSSTLFDIIRTETAIKAKGGWASRILDSFRTEPSAATSKLLNLVGTNMLDVAIYAALYILVIALLCWFLFRNIELLGVISSLFSILNRAGRTLIIFALIGLIVTATFVAREKRDVLRTEFFGDIYNYISTNVGQDEKIGYLLSSRSYVFYGKQLDRKVLYTPSKSDNLSQWLNDLHQTGVSVVAVGSLEAKMGWQQSRELQWLENADGPFTRVFGQNPKKEPMLYRFTAAKTSAVHFDALDMRTELR